MAASAQLRPLFAIPDVEDAAQVHDGLVARRCRSWFADEVGGDGGMVGC